MFINSHQLNSQQLLDLEQLKADCLKADDSLPSLYSHILAQERSVPSALLCYEKDRLIGFLSVFFFYQDAVEISVLIAPSARRKGLAKQLIQRILPLIQTYGYPALIFSSPAKLNDAWLSKLGFSFMHSEYHMKREDSRPLLESTPHLPIRNMQEDDIPALIHIDELCFSRKQHQAEERFHFLLNDRNYDVFVATQNQIPVGKAQLRWDTESTLSDIAVLPQLQGNGIGRSLIAHSINFALSEGKTTLCLDVETKNKRALSLYTRLGFFTQNSCDFWRIEIDQLRLSSFLV